MIETEARKSPTIFWQFSCLMKDGKLTNPKFLILDNNDSQWLNINYCSIKNLGSFMQLKIGWSSKMSLPILETALSGHECSISASGNDCEATFLVDSKQCKTRNFNKSEIVISIYDFIQTSF